MGEADHDRIRRVLTLDGLVPAGYAFLVDAVIYVWNPDAHFQRLAVRSAELERACRNYLAGDGRAFASLQHAADTAVSDRWRGWEKLARTGPSQDL